MQAKKIILLLVVILLAAYYTSLPKSVKTKSLGSETNSTVSIISSNLKIPWALSFLPDQSILVTERAGQVRIISPSGKLSSPILIPGVKAMGEGGLLGVTLHPRFEQNHFVYLYFTYAGDEKQTLNKVVRFVFNGTSFDSEKVIIDHIPGNSNHNGGRLKFGPDGFLYVTTGDSQAPSLAQNKSSLAGKILRVTDDGTPAPGNPFGNAVYSYGHRNPQGLAWDETGRLWEAEHGSSAGDEINLIEKGHNYGWPDITRSQTKSGLVTPILNSEAETWAPSGMVYLKPSLYFAGLRSNNLFRYNLETKQLDKFLSGQYGRLRDVILGPDGYLYLSTSNLDGRSLTHLDGDKVIRLDPASLAK